MYAIAFVFFSFNTSSVCDAKFELISLDFIIFIIFKMYLFFENATPRMNDVVFKMKIELMRRTPYDLRVRRTFFQERGGGAKLYAEFRIRGGPRNRPIAYTGGEL